VKSKSKNTKKLIPRKRALPLQKKHESSDELSQLRRELAEGQLRENAVTEILGVIASSPIQLQPVLDVVAENAAKICEATDASILRVEGETLRLVASY